jgi:hypothetical protein
LRVRGRGRGGRTHGLREGDGDVDPIQGGQTRNKAAFQKRAEATRDSRSPHVYDGPRAQRVVGQTARPAQHEVQVADLEPVPGRKRDVAHGGRLHRQLVESPHKLLPQSCRVCEVKIRTGHENQAGDENPFDPAAPAAMPLRHTRILADSASQGKASGEFNWRELPRWPG